MAARTQRRDEQRRRASRCDDQCGSGVTQRVVQLVYTQGYKKLDKDRFRQGLGGVIEAYEEVAQRIGVPL